MKIAHSAICTPNRCGLYETAREVVAAERALGADARIVDPLPNKQVGITGEDRGVPIADMEWGVGADLIVNHSGIDRTPLGRSDQPVIHVAHGRPLSTFMGERGGKAPGLTWATQRAREDRYCAAVTFWPEYLPYLKNIWGNTPCFYVPATVDHDYWCPGKSKYDFHGLGGSPNVVMTDPWSREDSSPYHGIHAFCLFRKRFPSAKLHMLAWDGNKKALTGLTNLLGDGGGTIQRWAPNVREVLRAADLLITPHRINTRSVREAMACGTQVVSGQDCHPEDIARFAEIMVGRIREPQPVREIAKHEFDPARAGAAFLEIATAALETQGVACGD